MLHSFKNILLVGLLLISTYASADRFSYVYIQGDKQIPFYVKLEDYMLPRYSKNYCIIPQLAPGPIHLQILFQQNQYPAQNFYVQVPPDGFRGFLLTKVETGFALYDIQQRFYLMPGEQGEDHLPDVNVSGSALLITENKESASLTKEYSTTDNNEEQSTTTETPPPANNENTAPLFMDMELTDSRKNVENNTTENEPQKEVIVQGQDQTTIQEAPITEQPAAVYNTTENYTAPQEYYTQQEIPQPQQNVAEETYNIANETSVEETGIHNTEEEMAQPVPQLIENAAPIINSDCPEPLNDSKFDDIFISLRGKNNDDKRISYLMKKATENCFTTRQAFLLCRQLEVEAMRYSFLKKIYPHITDQQNFPLLADALFKTMEWKSYFKLIYAQ